MIKHVKRIIHQVPKEVYSLLSKCLTYLKELKTTKLYTRIAESKREEQAEGDGIWTVFKINSIWGKKLKRCHFRGQGQFEQSPRGGSKQDLCRVKEGTTESLILDWDLWDYHIQHSVLDKENEAQKGSNSKMTVTSGQS